MADKRIPELNGGIPYSGVPAWDDLAEMVDTSDTTDHATGTSFPLELGKLIGQPPVVVDQPTGTAATDTAAINTALAAVAAGGTILFAPGTYVCNAEMRQTGFPDDVTLSGYGTTIQWTNAVGTSTDLGTGWYFGLTLRGAKGSNVDLDVDASVGDLTFSAPSHGLAAGDLAVIGSDAPFSPQRPAPQHCRGEFVRIREVGTPTADDVTPESPLRDDYVTVSLVEPTVTKYTMCKGLTIEGLRFESQATTNRFTPLALFFMERLVLRDVTVIDTNQDMKAGVYLFESYDVAIDRFYSEGIMDTNATVAELEGYPIQLIGVERCAVNSARTLNSRHASDVGSFRSGATDRRPISRDVIFKDSQALHTYSAAFSTHGGCENVSYLDSTAINCGGGAVLRGKRQTIKGCRIIGTHNDQIAISGAPAHEPSYTHGITIGENLSSGAGTNYTGIAGEELVIENNYIDFTEHANTNSGFYMYGIKIWDPLKNALIAGNVMKGYQSAAILTMGLTCDGLTLRDNFLDGGLQTAALDNASHIMIAAGISEANALTNATATPLSTARIEGVVVDGLYVEDQEGDAPLIRVMGGHTSSHTKSITVDNVHVKAFGGASVDNAPVLEVHDGFVDDIDIGRITGVLTTPYNADAATVTGLRYSNKGAATFVVAASDAPEPVKLRADYVCDGTDDEVEINAALALGSVLLTDGTYSVGATINMNLPGACLRGVGLGRPLWSSIDEGLSGTVIEPDVGFAQDTPVIAMEDNDQTISGGQYLGGLTIHGLDATNTGIDGVRFRAFQSVIENLLIHDMTGSGILVLGDDTASWNTYDSTIRNCMLSTCDIGLELDNDTGASATDLHIVDCTIMHNSSYGLAYLGGSSSQFSNCHWYNADATNAIRFYQGGSRSKFVGCKIESSQEHLVHIDNSGTGVSELQFSACSFMLGGQKTDNTYSLLKITGTAQCTHMLVTGCVFGEYGTPPANSPKYAIEVGNYAPYATIVGNNFNRMTFGTARLQLSATSKDNSVVRANLGVVDHTGTSVTEQTL